LSGSGGGALRPHVGRESDWGPRASRTPGSVCACKCRHAWHLLPRLVRAIRTGRVPVAQRPATAVCIQASWSEALGRHVGTWPRAPASNCPDWSLPRAAACPRGAMHPGRDICGAVGALERARGGGATELRTQTPAGRARAQRAQGGQTPCATRPHCRSRRCHPSGRWQPRSFGFQSRAPTGTPSPSLLCFHVLLFEAWESSTSSRILDLRLEPQKILRLKNSRFDWNLRKFYGCVGIGPILSLWDAEEEV